MGKPDCTVCGTRWPEYNWGCVECRILFLLREPRREVRAAWRDQWLMRVDEIGSQALQQFPSRWAQQRAARADGAITSTQPSGQEGDRS